MQTTILVSVGLLGLCSGAPVDLGAGLDTATSILGSIFGAGIPKVKVTSDKARNKTDVAISPLNIFGAAANIAVPSTTNVPTTTPQVVQNDALEIIASSSVPSVISTFTNVPSTTIIDDDTSVVPSTVSPVNPTKLPEIAETTKIIDVADTTIINTPFVTNNAPFVANIDTTIPTNDPSSSTQFPQSIA